MSGETLGPAGRLARAFIDSKLTPLLLGATVLLGLFTVWWLPREEEPQIVVPIFDVFVSMPGASPKEIEQRVTAPLEKRIWEIPGVEYVYSTSGPGASLVVVRFYVGEDEEDAAVKLNEKVHALRDSLPPGASPPLIKARSIDDVPILALTLWSRRYGHDELRRVAAELENAIKQVPDVSEVTIVGGNRRQLRVSLDPEALAGRGLTPLAVRAVIEAANRRTRSGSVSAANQELILETGMWLRDGRDVGDLVVGTFSDRPVFLRDVARVELVGEEPSDYVFFGRGAAAEPEQGRESSGEWPAVTLAVAKREGKNAVEVNHAVLEKVSALRGVIPGDVQIEITRDYGETAREKSDELLFHMFLAVASVSALIWLALGWRESVIVLLAVPATLALTLAVFYFYGFTLNRITLFALIFSIGILVDDAIVVVENIARHRRLPENREVGIATLAVRAVDEVGNPTILATLAVIAAILPMAFVRGLMGPYMRPIPIGASAAMVFSLLVAFVVTPWATIRLLGGDERHGGSGESASTRLYRRWMGRLVSSARSRRSFLAVVAILLLASLALVPAGFVRVKMLPFDNKSEFQVIVDMPEGTTLEQTARVAGALAEIVRRRQEVVDYQLYVGTAAPYNFNGLVRHYYLRRGAHVADIQVNLEKKGDRKLSSHEIAKRVRAELTPVAERLGARVKVAEVPPGPPVLQTLVAEIYGPNYGRQIEVARTIRERMEELDGVVDVDWYVEDPQPKYRLVVDEEKASFHGVDPAHVSETLRLAVDGAAAGLLHDENEREDVPIVLRFDRSFRSDLDRLGSLRLGAAGGALVSVGELTRRERTEQEPSIYHKNLMPVVYVTADVAGEIESPVYAMLKLARTVAEWKLPEGYSMEQYTARQPFLTERYALKWDGEWHITYEVFRDLGLAFAAVLLLIYVLVVAWFRSYAVPLVIMLAIPFSLVGILPAHGLAGAFFTATSMIGFIAGAGIVVRNSIILVDFIQLRRREGMPLAEAVVDAGAVRFRPMLLTAAAVVVAASVILFDPIFQGLAISLMAGEVASLSLSRVMVPVAYFLLKRGETSGPVPPS